MADVLVDYVVRDAVAWITMDRPEQRNAESAALLRDRDAAVRRAEADAAVRVLVIGGAGPSFSAGHDVIEARTDPAMVAERADVGRRVALERRLYFDTALRLQRLSKPTIAMVQGGCVAGGLMTAAMCDLIVAADDARFRDPTLGFIELAREHATSAGAPGVEVFFYPWQLPVRRAKELLFTGAWMSAADAAACGFVNRVVPPGELLAATAALAAEVAAADPASVALVKESFRRAQDLMGMAAAYEHHFLLHQLGHDGVGAAWLRPDDEHR